MARFVVGRPITTREPFIEVDAGLRPGVHRFQLEVVTNDGRTSKPDFVAVTVFDRTFDPLNPVIRVIERDVIRPVPR